MRSFQFLLRKIKSVVDSYIEETFALCSTVWNTTIRDRFVYSAVRKLESQKQIVT